MWRVIYPLLTRNTLFLIDDQDINIKLSAKVICNLLQTFVDYVVIDENCLQELINNLPQELEDLTPDTLSVTLDWLLLLITKKPQNLAKEAEAILNTMMKILPLVDNVVIFSLL